MNGGYDLPLNCVEKNKEQNYKQLRRRTRYVYKTINVSIIFFFIYLFSILGTSALYIPFFFISRTTFFIYLKKTEIEQVLKKKTSENKTETEPNLYFLN